MSKANGQNESDDHSTIVPMDAPPEYTEVHNVEEFDHLLAGQSSSTAAAANRITQPRPQHISFNLPRYNAPPTPALLLSTLQPIPVRISPDNPSVLQVSVVEPLLMQCPYCQKRARTRVCLATIC